MQAGLISNEANLSMIPSSSVSLPNGEEKGLYYGINVRGNSFLILRARLGGKNEPTSQLHREEIQIDPNIQDFKGLFDLIARELSKFISEYGESNGNEKARKKSNLGFTISPPVDDHTAGAPSCNAMDWNQFTEGHTAKTELTNEINQALEKHGVEMQVVSMVDDVVGDLAGGRYYSRESVVAVSLGMTTSVAYTESAKEVQKLQSPLPKSGEMVMNMQWGKFISPHLPITEFDASLNSESENPGKRIFEKLISGMYLGEVVRKVLVKMAQETALFGDKLPPKLLLPFSLRSPDMAAMHQDTTEDYEVVDEKLKDIFGIKNTTPMVREIVAEICDIVAERGARLVGAGIVGILKKLGRIADKKSVITIEGGLYEHYRIFRNYLHSSVWEMLGSDLSDNVIIEHSHGGSGAGSIFLAASHSQSQDSASL
ncbi:hypothetical protein M9H77_05637 [Catharanthus roseus]|uniref:Uncharacterized protein n=1 Tax=Catharanthus roseus TaxID=4058 RepID=A0ACC0CHH7_CATRO|nr:hypothetical protein M9H77_05637 [Catharanthus roseus]